MPAVGYPSGSGAARVLLVDDDERFRSSVHEALTRHGLRVVAQAADGREAVRLTGALRPDVVVMDIVMPEADGIQATRAIMERLPSTRIVLLTSSQDEELALLGLRSGAVGHLMKDMDLEELALAVRHAVDGDPVLSPLVARRLIEGLRDPVTLG